MTSCGGWSSANQLTRGQSASNGRSNSSTDELNQPPQLVTGHWSLVTRHCQSAFQSLPMSPLRASSSVRRTGWATSSWRCRQLRRFGGIRRRGAGARGAGAVCRVLPGHSRRRRGGSARRARRHARWRGMSRRSPRPFRHRGAAHQFVRHGARGPARRHPGAVGLPARLSRRAADARGRAGRRRVAREGQRGPRRRRAGRDPAAPPRALLPRARRRAGDRCQAVRRCASPSTARRAGVLAATGGGGWAGAPLVAFAPGAAYGGAKRWPAEHAATRGRWLQAAGRRTVLVGAGRSRRGACDRIGPRCRGRDRGAADRPGGRDRSRS